MVSEEVSLPLIHEHPMMPWNDLRKGDCCRIFEDISDGFYCKSCDLFFHKKCVEPCEFIQHPSHPGHTVQLQNKSFIRICSLCGKLIANLCYLCDICNFNVDVYCAKYPPPETIDCFEKHPHKLTLFKETWVNVFDCAAKCGKRAYGYPYKCDECDLSYHIDCIWKPSVEEEEVKHQSEINNHSYHSLHPLKLIKGPPPSYSDGKCRLCKRKVDELFYHCSSCNFTLDMRCVLHPPPQSHLDLKDHDHQLTLLPRLDSFTCNACGLKGDRSPYVCVQCNFMIHQECLGLPRVININRHDHRVSRTCVLGVVDSVCGVCRKKVDWTCGGYSCQRCNGYVVVHSKCATREDVWNGEELEGVHEEVEDIEPYVVIDGNTIHHFSHKEHHLRLNDDDGILCDDESKRCSACSHPICLQSFYGCLDCDFILHQKCAELPKKKWHVLDNDRLTLLTSEVDHYVCMACCRMSNGFRYGPHLDVMCGSISEPFVHPSHPDHPLYYILSNKDQINNGYGGICNGCNKKRGNVLRCIEDDCGFVLGFCCATLPRMVKHRVDDHPLSLCYGEEASGKYWCDICEKETNPKTWFYTCKDQRLSLHKKCVFGDFSGLMPRSTITYFGKLYEVVLNNSKTRPFCSGLCKSRCIHPIILKFLGTSNTYICSFRCMFGFNLQLASGQSEDRSLKPKKK